ncbi:MAG: GH116 family glycosyl hydrolase, partial [Capsulimonas sp.]|uniref:GH116 family glycosyl hydrolase n=1 Tax=Capsulimonas sp. TaxID=2494211 RepID=UPI0032632468
MSQINSNRMSPHVYRTFAPPALLQIAMPMGGLGAGCICLNGYGGLQDFSVRNRPATTALPDSHSDHEAAFALVHIKGEKPLTKLIEGPFPKEKLYDQGLQGQGYRHGGYEGMPRFENCEFDAAYPFGVVRLEDPALPLKVWVTGWSPFVPRDDVSSGMPCAMLEYRFENTSERDVEFEFSYHLTHLAGDETPGSLGRWVNARTSVLAGDGGAPMGVRYSSDLSAQAASYGGAALCAVGWTPRVKAMWMRGGWFDGVSALWREVSTGQFTENAGDEPVYDIGSRVGGSILGSATLKPGERTSFPIVIAWHFPNSDLTIGQLPAADCGADCDCSAAPAPGPAWRPFYAGQWRDAETVARCAANQYETLRARTLAFQHALSSSTLPSDVIDAVTSNLAILKSPTVLRQENGNVWGWEGCFTETGCCSGSCTHVWNYAQAMPHLFPKLERTLRHQELERSMDEQGNINFRSALPDGPTMHGGHAAADGQLGGILKICRDWHISGDTAWMEDLYPLAKRSLDYCIATWDPERRGGLFEPHHNTYDIEFWGPDGMCGSIYAGALSAMAQMARHLGRMGDADAYETLARRAAQFLSTELFNGEYYQQKVQWEGLRDTSFVKSIAGVNESSDAMKRLLQAEGPKYQYGSGCLSDGVIGAWMSTIYGVETHMDREQVRSTLRAIFQNNFKSDLSEHICLQRPGYALGHEPGLVLCTWPRGGKPTLPFVYSDEVWTGIEYQVAS